LRFEPLEERRLLTVITVNDLSDFATPQAAGNGVVTLRDAILAANMDMAVGNAAAGNGADTIQFAPGLTGTIHLTAGELLITDNVMIEGGGASILTIDAGGSSRIFHISDEDIETNITVEIDGVKLIGGATSEHGGAIYSEDNLTVTNSIISGNTAAGQGGGIAVQASPGGTVVIQNCTISGNASIGSGGGIWSHAYDGTTTTIDNCTITNNSAGSGSTDANGGGIWAESTANGTVTTIKNSMISGNTATGAGGGIGVDNDYSGTTAIRNCVVSGGNHADGDGGGIAVNNSNDGETTISDSTISGNTATGQGGGISINNGYGGTVTVQGATVSGGTAGTNGGGIAISGTENSTTAIKTTTISGDSKLNAAKGGGIFAYIDIGSSLLVENSTVSGNTASADGGGIWSYTDPTSTTKIRQSTISGNVSHNRGGGLYLCNYGAAWVQSSTITGNQSDAGGGGVYSYYDSYGSTTSPATVQSTIIAGNTDTSTTAPDVSGPVTLRYSLIGNNKDSGLTEAPVGSPDVYKNLIGDATGEGIINPLLGALADNGGPTKTHALLTGSPALNTGYNFDPTNLVYDQRGVGFVRTYSSQTDIGAFEKSVTLNPADIAILDGATSITDGQTTPISFGTATRGGTGITKTFTIRNDGQLTLILDATSFVSTSHFTVSLPGAMTLAAGATTTFNVTLKTDTAWTGGGETITIASNDSDENPFTFLVTGVVTGSPAEISVLDGTTLVIDGQTTAIHVGNASPGATGPSITLTIRNDGDQALTLGASSFVSTSHFTVSPPAKTSLAAGETTTFTVTLKTTAAWSGSEVISFSNNDSDESPFTFTVSGTVTISGPEIRVVNNATEIISGLTTVSFGSVVRDSAGVTKTFTITNAGSETLTLTTPFAGTTHFTVSNPLSSTLAPGDSTTFTITLKTDAVWSGAEVVSFLNNDTDNGDGVESPFTITVAASVTVAGPEVTVLDGTTTIADGQNAAISVGTSARGEAGASKTFTIRNDGDQDLILDPASFVSTSHFAVSQPGATTLAPGASTSFTVTLITDAAWTGTESISFNCNDPTDNESTFTFPVSGTVTKLPGEITVLYGSTVITDGQTTPINVGSSARGDTGASITITIRNDGDATLKLDAPFASTDHFTVSRPKTTSLAVGASTTFTITLKTDAIWSGSELISFGNSDGDGGDGVESPFDFMVSGSVTGMSQELTVLNDTTVVDNDQTAAIRVGTATHNASGPSKTFTIRNDGDQTLVLDPASFADTEHFTVSQPGKTSLAAGESTTFTVTLKTGAVWSGSDTISFTSNDGDNGDGVESPFVCRVSGTVSKGLAEITVLYGTNVLTDGQTAAVDVGSSVCTTTGKTITITVRNDGDKTMILKSSSFVDTTHFTVSKPDKAILAAGASTTFTITLKTGEVWSGEEVISFLSTDADNGDGVESPFSFAVSGTVTAPLHAISTIGEYDGSKGIFYLNNANDSSSADSTFTYGMPKAGWIAISGDWNGDGIETVGLYDPSTSTFFLKNTNTTGYADVTFTYGVGQHGWVAIVGDWNGDGVDTVGLYDPTGSTFYLKNGNTTGYADVTFNYGPAQSGWTAIAGDWNGDGRDSVGLYDPAASVFYLKNANSTGYADTTFMYGPGGAGWTPVTGDWDGDGTDTIGLFNEKGSDFYLRYTNDKGYADATVSFGTANRGYSPLAGVWTGTSWLKAADGVAASANVSKLTQSDLALTVTEAITRWAAAGVDEAALAKLAQVQVVISDLSGSSLGSDQGNLVQIDVDAAGHGWFVDTTPSRDEEFAGSGSQLKAVDSRAVDKIDLLSVVEHELGHILGFEDLDAMAEDVMSGVLGVGVRSLDSDVGKDPLLCHK
jgi:hypothetical protein